MLRENARNWLRITYAFGAANVKTWQYIDINKPLESLERLLSNSALQTNVYVRSLRSVSNAQLDGIAETCERNGIEIVTPQDGDYPEKLRGLPDPPSVLFVLGDISVINDMPSAAIVGARDCCEYSKAAAAHFSEELSRRGVSVISGFARGIDQAAHTAALSAGGVTAAVLGSGILYDYPRGSMRLKREIARCGAVISEYLPTARPAAENFKVRNRLITGLADCVLVVEAGERSGALNSAYHAAEQGREVFVLPPANIFDPNFKGQTGLLRDGASLALGPEDMLDFLRDRYSRS